MRYLAIKKCRLYFEVECVFSCTIHLDSTRKKMLIIVVTPVYSEMYFPQNSFQDSRITLTLLHYTSVVQGQTILKGKKRWL